LVCPTSGGIFYEYTIENGKAINESSFKGPSGTIHHFDWINDTTCFACNDYEMWIFDRNVR